MTIRIRPDFSGFNPDFSGLRRAFAEMGALAVAMSEGLDRLAGALTHVPAHSPTQRPTSALSTAYHRRHVRNRRRRSR